MIKAKEIIIDELNEQMHPERVEDVIFWALESYASSIEEADTWGNYIAYAIVQRIKEEEKKARQTMKNKKYKVQ